jgi:hypothetical protein
MQYGHEHPAWTGHEQGQAVCQHFPWCMLLVHIRAACSSQCSTDMDMQHGYGHEAYTETCSMDIDMQHGHWTCSMSMSMNMKMDKQHVRVHAIVHIQVHAAFPCPCCMDLNMLH